MAQILVPALALAHRPAQFGFQMYSGAGWTQTRVTDVHGDPIPVEPLRYVANLRPDIDWRRRLPEHLCVAVPEAARVTVTRASGSRSLTC